MTSAVFSTDTTVSGAAATLAFSEFAFVQAGVTVGSTNSTAIVAAGSQSTINILGSVVGSTGVMLGTSTSQGDIQLFIGAEGYVAGFSTGVSVAASNSTIDNGGTIWTRGTGIYISASSAGANDRTTITNSGSISGLLGVYNAGSNDLTFINTGSLVSNTLYYSLYGGSGDDTIVNSGRMEGDVALNNGLNSYDGRLGTLKGSVSGGTGIDTFYGGLGNDTLLTYAGNDYLDGGAGDDNLQAGDGDDVVLAGSGNDSIYGGIGGDSLNGDSGDDIIYAGDGNDVSNGGTGNDTLAGGEGTNIAYGGDGNDNISGGSGIDYMIGEAGKDTMAGGANDDFYSVDNAGDVVIEAAGQGNDIVAALVSYVLRSDSAVETFYYAGSSTAALTMTGNAFNQAIASGNGNDTINGGGGIDTLTGLKGNDTYITDGQDTIVEAAGAGTDTVRSSASATLSANVENLVLTGTGAINGTGNSAGNGIIGNGGKNTLSGAAGNDTLYGGLAADKMTGGTGKDSFVFNTTLGKSNIDTITDFSVADDTIQLARSVFKAFTKVGAMSSSSFFANTTGKAGDGSDRVIYEKDSGKLFYDADGTGSAGSVQIALLGKGLGLTHSDFLIV